MVHGERKTFAGRQFFPRLNTHGVLVVTHVRRCIIAAIRSNRSDAIDKAGLDGVVVTVGLYVDTVRYGGIVVPSGSGIEFLHQVLQCDRLGFHFAEREYVGT